MKNTTQNIGNSTERIAAVAAIVNYFAGRLGHACFIDGEYDPDLAGQIGNVKSLFEMKQLQTEAASRHAAKGMPCATLNGWRHHMYSQECDSEELSHSSLSGRINIFARHDEIIISIETTDGVPVVVVNLDPVTKMTGKVIMYPEHCKPYRVSALFDIGLGGLYSCIMNEARIYSSWETREFSSPQAMLGVQPFEMEWKFLLKWLLQKNNNQAHSWV